MLKNYIEPEIEVLEIAEHVFCAESTSDVSTDSLQVSEEENGGENIVIDTPSGEPAESISPATEKTAEPAPVEVAPEEA